MHKQRPLVLIDGWWGSGKTTLRGLLDGHPQLAVCPIQESLPGILAHDPANHSWLQSQELSGLRRCLGVSIGYNRTERFALAGAIAFDAARRVRIERPFNFDFYTFDKLWVQRVLAEENSSIEKLVEIYYDSFMQCWKDFDESRNDYLYHVTLDDNRPKTPPFFVQNLPSGKLLYLIRDPKGILATRAGRLPCKGDSRTAHWEDLSPEQLLREGELHRIRDAYGRVQSLAARHPNRVMPVSFEALVEDTGTVMEAVADFLGIDYGPILETFSYLGEPIGEVEGVSFIGRVNDQPSDLLSPSTYAWAQLILKELPLNLRTMRLHPEATTHYVKRAVARRVFSIYSKCERVIRRAVPS